MPRVLHVTPYLDASAGGPPVVVERLVAAAADNGYDATILTSAEMTADNGAALHSTHADLALVQSQGAAFRGPGRQIVNTAVAAADILHLHTMWSPLAGLAAREAGRRGIPYVLSPHGMLDPYSFDQKRLKKQVYLALFERGTLKGTAKMLFTAEEERRLAAPLTGPLPSSVVALGADRPPAPPETLRDEFLDLYPDLANRPRAVFMGRLHDKKRPASTLRAMDIIRRTRPDAMLLMVGSGEAEAELRSLADELGLWDNLRFLGFLSGRSKWQALAAADLFLLPSRQENFAIALAEALHAGVPALLTKRVNIWEEVISAGAGALLDEDGIEDHLARECLAYFNDADRRTAASAAARQLSARAFDWSVSAARTHAVYDDVLGRNTGVIA